MPLTAAVLALSYVINGASPDDAAQLPLSVTRIVNVTAQIAVRSITYLPRAAFKSWIISFALGSFRAAASAS